MKSKETGFGKRTLSLALATILTAGPTNAKEAVKKVKDIIRKGSNKDAPTVVHDVQGKMLHVVDEPNTSKGKEKKEVQEFDSWGFPSVEIVSYVDLYNEMRSKDLKKFLKEKEQEDGKQYYQYLNIEGVAFMDFVKYLNGHTAIKDSDGEVVKTTLSQNPEKIAKYTPVGGSTQKVRGFKEELAEYDYDLEDFQERGFTISNLDTLKKNIEISLGTLNRGKESLANGIRETETRTKANDAEGVITQPEVRDSLNRIGNNISKYFKALRDNTVDPCILGTEFLIEDVSMMIAYYKSKGMSTSPDANGNHKPDRITLKQWRDIQVENPQYQTQSYNAQRAQETAASYGAVLIPKGQKVPAMSIVDVVDSE